MQTKRDSMNPLVALQRVALASHVDSERFQVGWTALARCIEGNLKLPYEAFSASGVR